MTKGVKRTETEEDVSAIGVMCSAAGWQGRGRVEGGEWVQGGEGGGDCRGMRERRRKVQFATKKVCLNSLLS